jgi:hypothetical protein
MNAIGALYADQALRLANERMVRDQRESAVSRSFSVAGGRSERLNGLRRLVLQARAALVVDVEPRLPALSDYPYRG